MLHIILTILKVIGIILLVILGIAAALIFLVLFWPLSYRGHLVREDGAFKADMTASWLLRLISAEFHFQDKKGILKLKIFGKVLKTIEIPKGSGGDRPGKKNKSARMTAADEEHVSPQEENDAEGISASPQSGGNAEESSAYPQTEDHAEESSAYPQTEDHAEESSASPQAEYAAEESPDPPAAAGKAEAPPSEEKRKGFLKKFSGKVGKAFSNILQRIRNTAAKAGRKLVSLAGKAAGFIRKLIDLVFRAQELPSDIGNMTDAFVSRAEEKVRSAEKKAGPFLTADAFAFYKRALGYLMRFLRCCRFRKLEGYLLVGTGAPDTTGKLIGLIYLVLPAAEGDYDLQADFYEKAFRTDTAFAGHIRLNHALMLVIRLFKDKEFRRLLAHIRHRDGKKEKERKRSGRRKTDQ